MNLPFLVFSDKQGKIYHHPSLLMVGVSLNRFVLPHKNELVKIPLDTSLFYIPNSRPLGFNPNTNKIEILEEFEGREVFAASAAPLPAYLRTLCAAGIALDKRILPFLAYTACGFYGGNFYIAAKRVDKRQRQSPRFYNNKVIAKKVRDFYKKHTSNRLYQHLSNCALNYNCLAAKNLFLNRWEAPVPVSRFCNAKCIGCISYQASSCIAPHERINFKPKVSEIIEVMVSHLKTAKEAIASFGQGCEGEPLLEADLIAEAIYKARQNVCRGTINMNTNASMPEKIKLLCQAGMDSFRVSLNSPSKKFYDNYFKPIRYKFSDVLKSIEIMKKYKKFVSINLFIFPGFSDSEQEVKSLIKFIDKTGIDMIQWRNLNIDTNYFLARTPHKNLRPQGVLSLIEVIKKRFPKLKHGYFNLPKEQFWPV